MTIVAKVLCVWLALAAAASAQQLCPPEKLEALRASLPHVEDEHWQRILQDPTTLLYTDAEIPPAYQHADAGLLVTRSGRRGIGSGRTTSFHSPSYNISGDAREAAKGNGRGGNGNIEFPWRTPGGTDQSEGLTRTFKLLWLPKQESGKPWPVVWHHQKLTGSNMGSHVGYAWTFPAGAVLGEVLALRDARGSLHTFELRLRTREEDHWDVEILRPFPEAQDLADRLAEYDLPQLADRFREDVTLKKLSLVDRLHPTKRGFAAEAAVDELPALDEALAAQLLDNTPFKSASGKAWRKGANGVTAFAPTTNQAFSIVPRGYHGTFLGTDAESCAKCHESTLKHVDEFDRRRDWYGYIRGADGIFSFHPIEPASISYSGVPLPVRIRRSLVEAGVVAAFDAQAHPAERYQPLAE